MPKKKLSKHAATLNSHEVPSDMGVFAEKEGSGTSDVPKTSQSICRTLGSNNTQSYAIGEAAIDKTERDFPKKSFASLFKDNRNPSNGIFLYKVED